MGKGTDLWDDSALINAFDHAMDTYKKTQTHGNHNDYAKEGNYTSGRDEHDLVLIEKGVGHSMRRNVEPVGNSDNISSDTTKARVPYDNSEMVPKDFSSQGNTFGADVHALESEPHSSGIPCAERKTQSSSDQQSTDYDQLLRQYYELEEQKERVLQQLHQANYWNYQTPVQSSDCQLPQVSGYSTSDHGLQAPSSLFSCHCADVLLIPSSACALGGPSSGCYSCYPSQMTSCSGSQACHIPADTMKEMDLVNHSEAVDSGIKVGTFAVESAINFMKMQISDSSNDNKGKKEEDNGSCTLEGNGLQSISSETDLSAVLNAWFQAGFNTGRYLSERSKENAHR